MTATSITQPQSQAQASDLPPEISALIEAAVARAARRAPIRRPTAPIVHRSVPEAPLRVPHLATPKKRTRVFALGDLVLVGLFAGLLLAAWVSLLIGLNMAEAAQRTTRACITQTYDSAVSRPVPNRTVCPRMSQHG